MNYTLLSSPENLVGNIYLPRSKSISNRALIIQALCKGKINIEQLSKSEDTEVLKKALESLDGVIDVGPAGTAYRFMTAFLSQHRGHFILTGSERMKQRPIKLLVDTLRNLGAKIEYDGQDGFPPLKIYGGALSGGVMSISGSISSQYISALLLIAPVIKGGLTLKIDGRLTSRPYVQMTLNMMYHWGVKWEWSDDIIKIEEQEYKEANLEVESDWSAASYWYELLSFYPEGELFLYGLKEDSLQGDATVCKLFSKLGVQTTFEEEGVRIVRSGEVAKNLKYNFIEIPDLAQTLVVTCAALGVPFYFEGLHTLKVKETNRVDALIKEMHKFGFVLIEPKEGCLSWDGTIIDAQIIPEVETYDDHRMAMSFAPLIRFGQVIINDIHVVGKSYPSYWEDLKKLGFNFSKSEM